MARIAYADPDSNAETLALAEQIKRERGGRLLNLYRMLLNSPPVVRGWLNLLTAVRQQAQLAGRYRELAILRIAILNGAEYERAGHVPHALKEGVTQAQIDALTHWEQAGVFDPADRAVLAYTDAMTREVHVGDAAFDALRPHFDARELTELTATIGAYNMVSRFLEALQVDPEIR
jgi:alkylhydroperoxidase family enzyme